MTAPRRKRMSVWVGVLGGQGPKSRAIGFILAAVGWGLGAAVLVAAAALCAAIHCARTVRYLSR